MDMHAPLFIDKTDELNKRRIRFAKLIEYYLTIEKDSVVVSMCGYPSIDDALISICRDHNTNIGRML